VLVVPDLLLWTTSSPSVSSATVATVCPRTRQFDSRSSALRPPPPVRWAQCKLLQCL